MRKNERNPIDDRGTYVFARLYRPHRLVLADCDVDEQRAEGEYAKSRTNTQYGRLKLRRRHALEYTRPNLAQVEKTRKLYGALLELQLGAGRVSHEQIAYSLLLRSRRRGPRRDFRDRGEDELAREVVGVRRVEDGHQEVDELLVGDLDDEHSSEAAECDHRGKTHRFGLFLVYQTTLEENLAVLADDPSCGKGQRLL